MAGNLDVFHNNSIRLQDVSQPTNSANARSEVDPTIYRPQPSSAHYTNSSQNFNWSPQYILNQINQCRSNSQQQNESTEFCNTNAPYLTMRQHSSQRLGLSSQNILNYSRYSGGRMYGAIQPRCATK